MKISIHNLTGKKSNSVLCRRMYSRLSQFVLGVGFAAALAFSDAHAEVYPVNIEQPLQDAAVTRAPDGTWVLTGTISSGTYAGAPDFLSNDGIKFWTSSDLVNWKEGGYAFRFDKVKLPWHHYNSHFFALPERPLGAEAVRGYGASRVAFLKGEVYITYTNAGMDVQWLKGKSLKADGFDFGRVQSEKLHRYNDALAKSSGPPNGMLFEDKDGSVYLVRGAGWLEKLLPDLTQTVPKSAQFLLAAVEGYPNADWCAQQFDPQAATLTLWKGKYILCWTAFTDDGGFKRADSFAAVADALSGPYSEPTRLIPGSGPVELFDGGDKGLLASCSIENKPLLVTLTLDGGKLAAPKLPALPKMSLAAKPAPTLTSFDYANAKPTGQRRRVIESTGRSVILPLFDQPLADISIHRGTEAGKTRYILTGTAASKTDNGRADFENNDGIYLWSSADLETWTPLGKVWDIEKQGDAWQKQYRIPAGNPVYTDFARGITSPEIFQHDGAWHLLFSMNGRGIGLLRSESDKAEGPYRFVGRLTGCGESPSFFLHPDGTTFALWGKGAQIAAVDLKKGTLTTRPKDLLMQFEKLPDLSWGQWVGFSHPTAPMLLHSDALGRKDGVFYLAFTAVTQVFERANRDVVITRAQSLDSPFVGSYRMIPNAGESTVFTDDTGKMFATFGGDDPSALFRKQAGIVEMEWYETGGGKGGKTYWPRKQVGDYHTERGPWSEVLPIPGLEKLGYMRDGHVLLAPDGYYYFSASGQKNSPLNEGVRYYRAKSIKGPWEDIGVVYSLEQMLNDPAWPTASPKSKEGYRFAMEPQMEFHDGTYWISVWLGGPVCGKGPDGNAKEMIAALLRSTTGKPEGPYEFWSRQPPGAYVGLQALSDGSVISKLGASMIWKMTPELMAKHKHTEQPPAHKLALGPMSNGRHICEDCGFQILELDGKFLFFGLCGYQTYDTKVSWADKLEGPYHFMGVLPKLGNSPIIQDVDGKWYTVFPQTGYNIHETFKSPWRTGVGEGNYASGAPFIYEVIIDLKSEKPSIWPAHDVGHTHKAVFERTYEVP